MLDGTDQATGVDQGVGEIISAHAGTTDWREADRALRGIARRRAALDVEEAAWLVRAQRAQVHRHRGFGSFLEYMERVLGYGPRAALDRLRVASAVELMPALRDALRDGTPFSALRELARVVVPETVGEWLADTQGKSLREIESMVSGKKRGDGPETPEGGPRRRRLLLDVSAETYALYREVQRAVATRAGHHVDEDTLLNTMCRSELAAAEGAGERAGYQVAVMVCDRCRRGYQDGGGVTVEVSPEAVAVAECDAQRIGRLDASTPQRAVQDILPAVRRLVWRRDHGRCVVPGCRASRNLDLHHIVHREDGGGHDLGNLCLVCSGHHAAHHRGELEIRGVAPALSIRFLVQPPPVRDEVAAARNAVIVGDATGGEAAVRPHASSRASASPRAPASPSPRASVSPLAGAPGAPLVDDLVRAAVVKLGYKPGPAWVAVRRARAHVGAEAGFDLVLREALKAALKT